MADKTTVIQRTVIHGHCACGDSMSMTVTRTHDFTPYQKVANAKSTDAEIEAALTTAIEAGYRHIDTAYIYSNEKAIGNTLQKLFKSGKIKREELFIVTKLPLNAMRAADVEPFLKKSLENLQLDYVDLYLILLPVGLQNRGFDELFPKDEEGRLLLDLSTDHVTLWKAMEEQVDAGRTKSIGLSNFNKRQIQRLLKTAKHPIANLQVELHIYLQQKDLRAFCRQNGITVCAYSPLGSPSMSRGLNSILGLPHSETERGAASPMEEPLIIEIAKRHEKLPAQILLRFLLQSGVAVIPKSTNRQRIKQNIDVFDFELTKEEVDKISALDRGEKGRMFNNSPLFKALSEHPEYPHVISE